MKNGNTFIVSIESQKEILGLKSKQSLLKPENSTFNKYFTFPNFIRMSQFTLSESWQVRIVSTTIISL